MHVTTNTKALEQHPPLCRVTTDTEPSVQISTRKGCVVSLLQVLPMIVSILLLVLVRTLSKGVQISPACPGKYLVPYFRTLFIVKDIVPQSEIYFVNFSRQLLVAREMNQRKERHLQLIVAWAYRF